MKGRVRAQVPRPWPNRAGRTRRAHAFQTRRCRAARSRRWRARRQRGEHGLHGFLPAIDQGGLRPGRPAQENRQRRVGHVQIQQRMQVQDDEFVAPDGPVGRLLRDAAQEAGAFARPHLGAARHRPGPGAAAPPDGAFDLAGDFIFGGAGPHGIHALLETIVGHFGGMAQALDLGGILDQHEIVDHIHPFSNRALGNCPDREKNSAAVSMPGAICAAPGCARSGRPCPAPGRGAPAAGGSAAENRRTRIHARPCRGLRRARARRPWPNR